MPSFHHELLVDLFRKNGELAAELLRVCAGIAVDHDKVEGGSIDFSQVVSTEYRADNVAIFRDGAGRAVTGVIVEIQRDRDRDKLLSWPVYVATLRAQHDCPAVLLVIAPEPSVARWARRPIELGHPRFQLTPIVIGFDDVPHIRDRAAASHLPELAMLSVVAHPELEIAEAAVEAIKQLPEDREALYYDVILNVLSPESRRILEARMIKGYEYQSDFARRYYGAGQEKGREEGREEGEQKGREEGEQKGREQGLRAAVITLARIKLGELSDADIAEIEAVCDPQVLTRLVTSLGRARSAARARAVLDRVRAR